MKINEAVGNIFSFTCMFINLYVYLHIHCMQIMFIAVENSSA